MRDQLLTGKGAKIVGALTVLVLTFGIGVGQASADHTGGTEWTCNIEVEEGEPCPPPVATPIGPAAQHALAPVGSAIGGPGSTHPGFINGIQNPNAPDDILFNNPLCPFHGVEHVDP